MGADEDAIVKAMHAKAEAKRKANADNPEMAGFTTGSTLPSEGDKEKDKKPTFKLKIYSPYKIYYEEEANSVTADNDTGLFDILPGHKNFLTLLKQCDMIIRNYRGDEVLKVNRGILHVRSGVVTVFLDV